MNGRTIDGIDKLLRSQFPSAIYIIQQYYCIYNSTILHYCIFAYVLYIQSHRLFGNQPNAKADYTNVPTVVFSHPVIGTCGLTEQEAEKEYGQENLKIYTSGFVNLWYGPYFEGGPGDKPISKYKLICEGPTQRVVGLHMIGMGSDEVLQGFGVAMKMGATKLDFDNCVAIHPTAAEEMVTLPPWGLLG